MKIQSASHPMTLRLWAELLLLSVLWGGSFLFGRIAAAELPAFTIAFSRVLLAAALLWTFVLVTRRNHAALVAIAPWILLLGLLNNAIPFTLIFWGQQQIGAGLASVLNGLTPIWTLLLASMVVGDEEITRLKLAGILAGFCGIAVLLSENLASGIDGPLSAKLAVMGAGISYAFASVFARRFRLVDPVLVATGQLTGSSLLLLLPALLVDRALSLPMPSFNAIGAVIGLATLCTAFAYVLFFRILAKAGATNISLVTFLIPPSALLLGAVFLGEKLSLVEAAGMVLVAIALACVDGRLLRNQNH